ncbi:MAG TPA: nuclear transport factor 2 family protein [Pyrinomonadaceae bacterium]|nr:nuclear transport factor 2 family protein [Pyrinomonadaceae bacterium]
MNKLPLIAIVILIAVGSAFAQTAPDAAELTKLLNEFLAGASRGDASIHERFWADDLIYTRSAGRRVSKAEVLHDVRNTPAPKPGDPVTIYTAEDIRIQQYGDTAIVAFRLVATTDAGKTKSVANLLNSGTFVKRNGKWQVVNWQSTRMPRTEDQSQKEVASVLMVLTQGLGPHETAKLRSVIDPSFEWRHRFEKPLNQKQFIDDLMSGQVNFAVSGLTALTLSVYGDTVIVRGVMERMRSGKPERLPYTMTFVNQIGGWRIMALDTN